MAWGGAAFLATSFVLFVGYKIFMFFYSPDDSECYQDLAEECGKPPIAIIGSKNEAELNETNLKDQEAKYLQILGSLPIEDYGQGGELPPSYPETVNKTYPTDHPDVVLSIWIEAAHDRSPPHLSFQLH